MSYPADGLRARKERLAAAIREKRIRDERRVQSDLGERGRAGGLMSFIRYFWHILEPNTPLVIDMQMEAICLHLEAVTRGEIKRLCINVSPGAAKSLIVNVYWPAWEWSAAGQPWQRFVTFAYASHLTERDNGRFRDVIKTTDFQEMWGHVFRLTEDGKIKPTNNATGWKFSSSIRGVGTGERGNRILCFPADQKVATEIGSISIGDIVERRLQVKAWSFNASTNSLELKPIVGWHRNPGRPLVKVTTESGASVTCTHDHRVYTANGLVEASLLQVGHCLLRSPWSPAVADRRKTKVLPCTPSPNGSDGAGKHSEFLSQGTAAFFVPGVNFTHTRFRKRKFAAINSWGKRQIQPSPLATPPDRVDCCRSSIELIRQGYQRLGRIIYAHSCSNLAHDVFRKVSGAVFPVTMPFAVRNVVGTCPVLQVVQSWVTSISVFVANLLAHRAWPHERFHNQLVYQSVGCFPFLAQTSPRVSVWRRGNKKHLLWDRQRRPGVHSVSKLSPTPSPLALANPPQAFDATARRNGVETFKANNGAPFFDRVHSVEFLQDIPSATYCISVADNGNLFCGDNAQLLTKNCDDLHNVKEGDSEAVRSETVRWAREGMSNRLNDMQEDVIVLIGQRVHDEDVSAALLNDDLGYIHLSIPMEYDPTRHCVTEWWEDPRTEYGELASPIRFPAHIVGQLKRTLGPYAWSAQYQQSPEPRGGGILKRDWWGTHVLPLGGSFKFQFEYIVASLDPAFTAKQENDPSGFTVWGVYYDRGDAKICLLHAWKKWLELHGQTMERLPTEDNRSYVKRASPSWGLVEWVAHDCARLRVHQLLIEDKASGHSVAQEIQRLYRDRDWGVRLVNPGNLDKRARAYAIQHLFADGMIEAPASESGDLLVFREWAQMVIDECAKFRGLPGDEDNLVDSATQAIKFLRDQGLAVRGDERRAVETARMTKRHGPRPHIYAV